MELRHKVRRAARMLLIRSHSRPGVRGWELRRALGDEWLEVLRLLDGELGRLGLTVRSAAPDGGPVARGEEIRAQYFVTFSDPPEWPELRGSGWRIDDMAALAAALSLILAKGGRAAEEELVDLLSQKLPKWRASSAVRRFVRSGYLEEVEEGVLGVGWRSRVEVDLTLLMRLMLGRSPPEEPPGGGSPPGVEDGGD